MENELLENEAAENDSAEHEAAEAKRKATDYLSMIKTREHEFDTGWWKAAEESYDLYAQDKEKDEKTRTPYNILYSNTEVLLPSLYSSVPKPDVRVRFKGDNAKLKPIPELVSRFLQMSADAGAPGTDSLDHALSDATLSSLVPGMGYIRIRLKPELSFPITYESGHYKTLIWGKANRWSKVPWVAFKYPMKRSEMLKQFGLDKPPEGASEDEAEEYSGAEGFDSTDPDDDGCCVYEFWHKESRKVFYLCEEWREKLIQETDDPMGLEGFYPTPGPLLLTAKPGKLNPIPLYSYYQNQAQELNRVSVRLNRVLSAIKVRGAYNGMLGDDLKNLLSDDDSENSLIAAGEAALLAQSGGFDKHIWLLPIEKLITVAQELYRAREAIKQVIYEITGISDIIRGSSVASETATAQDLKSKWGTVRLRKMQTIIANYSRDLFRLAVDCAADKLPAEQWKAITQLPLPMAQEKMAAQQRMQQVQMLTPPPMPGQPPAPPNPELAQLQQVLSQPSLEEVLGSIKSDQNRTFIVNIQTSSTVDLDTAQDKTEVSEFMNAMGQLLAGLQPLAMMGPTGVEAMKAILIAVSQRYKFGLDLGDVLAKIQPPPPAPPEGAKGPSPAEQAAAQAEAQVAQQEAQFKMAKIASDMRVLAAQERLELAKIAAAEKQLSLDIDAASLRLQSQRAKIPAKGQTQNATV